MPNIIRIRRGLKKDLPTVAAEGIVHFVTDTGELYVGTGNGIAPVSYVETNRILGYADATISSGTTIISPQSANVWGITASSNLTVSAIGWKTHDSLEILAKNWGSYTITLPTSWKWGIMGVPTFGVRDRIILRTDDGGTTVDAMLAFSTTT